MSKFQIATIQDIAEIEKVPVEKRLTAFNTYDLLRQGVQINPDALAISFMLSGDLFASPMKITYRDFWSQLNRTANLFHDLGIGPRDVISYLLPNLPHTHYVLWGGEAAGIVNPINPLLEAPAIKEICQAAGTKVLVALTEVPGADIWQKVMAIRKDLPHLKAIIRVMGPTDEQEGIYGYDEVVARYDGTKLNSNRKIDPQDIASMYHTGGTTGTPKIAPHTHFNEAAMAFMAQLAGDLNAGEAILCGLPLFHVNGTTVTGSMPFSLGGHAVILSPRGYRDPSVMQNFYKIVEHYRAVTFSCVPTVLSVLLDLPKGNADISSLRYAICGAAPLSVELFQRFEAHSGMKILEGYGLTEGACASAINPFSGERRVGSIGLRLPYQEMKVFIVDDQGQFIREAGTDEIGSICIKGPNVFAGYLEKAHNKGVWPKPDWFNTGDLGRRDAQGYFWLTGRKKDLIIRGGHNIDPVVIEEPLYRLLGVQTAAAVSRPDPHAGEVPVAYVQLQEKAELTAEQIMEYLKKEVGERAAVPKDVFIVKEIPLTPVGKIYKPALRWDAIRRVFMLELQALGALAESVEVRVGEDRLHGTVATLLVRPAPQVPPERIQRAVNEVLARYPVKYRLEMN